MAIYRFIVDTDRHRPHLRHLRHLEAIKVLKVLKVLSAKSTIFSIMAAIIGFSMAVGGDDSSLSKRLRHKLLLSLSILRAFIQGSH